MVLRGNDQYILTSQWIDDEDDLMIMKIGTPPIWAKQAEQQLKQYFAGQLRLFQLPVHFTGSEFQNKVWTALQHLSYGNTSTYIQLASLHWDENHSRAVGAAIGSNPLLLFIPCHRVVGADGSLVGYAGGLDRKSKLLRLEGALNNGQLSLF